MGILDIFKRNKKTISNVDEIEIINEENKSNKYDELFNDFRFKSIIFNFHGIEFDDIEKYITLPNDFLDRCLDSNFLAFLFDNYNKIDKELFEKIEDNSLTIDDLSYDSIFLLDILPSSPRVDAFKNRNKSDVDPDEEYIIMEGNNDLSCKNIDHTRKIDSFFEGVEVIVDSKKIPKKLNSHEDAEIRFIAKNTFGYRAKYADESIINEDSIILISFEKYKELSKNPKLLDILKKHKLYILDDIKERQILFDKNYIYIDSFYQESVDTDIADRIKYNHLVKIISESNLSEIEKKYYLYIYDVFNTRKIVEELKNKIGIEEIKRITNGFNKQSFEEKTTEVEREKYSFDLFIYMHPDFYSQDLEGKIDILSSLRSDEFLIVIQEERIKSIFENKINDKSDLYEYRRLIQKINEISGNKCIMEFMNRQGLDVKKVLETKEYDLQSEYDINPILARYRISDSYGDVDLSIADIVGFSRWHIRGETNNMLDNFSSFFKDSGDSYHTRSSSLLDFKSGEEALEKLRSSFIREPLSLDEYDNKHVVSINGLHRTIILRFFYIKELLEGKLTEEELREKYKIPKCDVSETNIEKTYLNYLLCTLDSSVKRVYNHSNEVNGLFEPSKEANLTVNYYDVDEKKLSLDQIKERIKFLLSEQKDMYKLTELKENYQKYPSFKGFMDTNFSEYIYIFNESEENQHEKSI